MKRLYLATALALYAAPALCEVVPRALSVDARSATAIYQEGEVYRINTQLRRVTLITLAPGERFLDFKAGDTESFQFADTDQGSAILVKPVIAGAVTNGVIVTNRRFYLVELHESATRRPHYSVSFRDPAGSRRSSAPSDVPPGAPKTYMVSVKTRDAQISPIRVRDDGRKTYFEFGPDAPIPSIYRADASGREFIVNTRTDGTTITVSSRSDRWVIRYGDEFICVVSAEVANVG